MVSETTSKTYEVVLVETPVLTRYGCRICGYGYTEKDEVVATINGPHREGRIFAVCHDCLEAGPAGVAERLTEHAENLEHRAGILRLMAQGEWVMPSLDELLTML